MKIQLIKTSEADVDSRDSSFCGQHCSNLSISEGPNAIWRCSWYDNVDLKLYDEKENILKRCEKCIKEGEINVKRN